MFFLNAFAFLEVEPQFKCQNTPGIWTYSTPQNTLEYEYCNTDQCEINWESEETYRNLIVQLNFECAPKW